MSLTPFQKAKISEAVEQRSHELAELFQEVFALCARVSVKQSSKLANLSHERIRNLLEAHAKIEAERRALPDSEQDIVQFFFEVYPLHDVVVKLVSQCEEVFKEIIQTENNRQRLLFIEIEKIQTMLDRLPYGYALSSNLKSLTETLTGSMKVYRPNIQDFVLRPVEIQILKDAINQNVHVINNIQDKTSKLSEYYLHIRKIRTERHLYIFAIVSIVLSTIIGFTQILQNFPDGFNGPPTAPQSPTPVPVPSGPAGSGP